MKFSTLAIHGDAEVQKNQGAVMPPIFMTSTFERKSLDSSPEYEYTRAGNPNFTLLENTLARLEKGKFATAFSAGLGALTAMVSTLAPGDKVLALGNLYGGSYRLFSRVFNNYGIQLINLCNGSKEDIEKHLQEKPKWLFIETPTNPLLEIFDIAELSMLAKSHGVLTVVDNTFATPYFQNPLLLGADIVWHSTTKYIGGHSDVIGGMVITNDEAINEQMVFLRMALGLNPSPFDTWLLLRGVKTLAIRMEKHQENALKVVNYLQQHPMVNKLYYPGLESSLNHIIAKKQMKGFSGIVTAEFNLALDQLDLFLKSLKIFTLAESLGGVESLVCIPALMTHASIPKEERKRIGISDSLVRLSVGIEDSGDIIADLDQALQCFTHSKHS